MAYEAEVMFFLNVAWMAASVVLVVVLARRWWGWRRQASLKHLPESMKEGSSLVTVPLQQFPFVVGIYAVKIKNPDKKEFKGSGTIIDGHIVTAAHVVADVKPALTDVDLTTALYARTFDGQYHLLGEWTQIHTDAVFFKAPQGYKSGRIETLCRPQHAQVVAARDQANSSMGILKNSPQIAYGFVEYDGSTIAGFSGSPYTNGQKVLGMHLQGGTNGNFGYSASFLVSKMRRVYKPESSEWEAFERALAQASQDDVEWDRGLDETEIRVGGRYFLFENEEFDEYIEESEFMDWFYEPEETQGSHKTYKWKKSKKQQRQQKRGDYFEPNYSSDSDVSYEGGNNDFLGPQPQKDSSGADLSQDIASLTSHMKSIQNSLTSLQKDMDGLKEQMQTWSVVSTSMQELDLRLMEHVDRRLTTSLSGLEHSLTELIRSSFAVPQNSMSQSGTSASDPSSRPLTPPVAQDSEPSPSTALLGKRWDGMESDFEKYKTWRCSANLSDPGYVHLREEYLKSIGMEPWQSRILINRMQNVLKKSKNRALMAQKRTELRSS